MGRSGDSNKKKKIYERPEHLITFFSSFLHLLLVFVYIITAYHTFSFIKDSQHGFIIIYTHALPRENPL